MPWFSGTATAHGNFTLASGSTVDVDVALVDQNQLGAFASGWDGASLTVTSSNAGTLILSGTNTYTGATLLNGGTLALATPGDAGLALAGSPLISFAGTAALNIRGDATIGSRITVGGGAVSAVDIDAGKLATFTLPLAGGSRHTDVVTGGRLAVSGSALFADNKAQSVYGAALNAANGALVTFGDMARFTGNTVNKDGGALVLSGTVIFRNGAVFASNTAGLNSDGSLSGYVSGNTRNAGGGAIATPLNTPAQYLYIGSNAGAPTLFENNVAHGMGGAIYMVGGHLELDAARNDIIFRGNTYEKYGNSLTGVINGRNSIFMRETDLTLNADAGRTIYFYDQIMQDATGGTVKAITKTGDGRVYFTGANTTGIENLAMSMGLLGAAGARSRTLVNAGLFELADGMIYGSNQDGVDFTLATSATLRTSGAGNISLRGGGLFFQNGSLVDITGNTTLTLTSGTARFEGGSVFAGQGTLATNSVANSVIIGASAGDTVTGLVNAGGTLTVSARLSGTGALDKTGAGRLVLTGTGSRVGAMSVTAGLADHRQRGAFTTDGDYTVAAGGTLALSGSSSIVSGGAYAQDGALLVTAGANAPAITAQTSTLGAASTLTVTGFTGAASGTKASQILSATSHVLIHTTGGITGDFAVKNITGPGASPQDFLLTGGYIRSGTDYVLGSQQAWFSGTPTSHGNFTLGAGESFDIDVTLANTIAHAGWDGRSLTKKGDGLLILSAGNTYSGSTSVQAGELRITHTAALGAGGAGGAGGLVDIAANATLTGTFAGAYTFTNTLTGAGLLDVNLTTQGNIFALTGNNTAFTGTARLANSTFTLANNTFAAATLVSATGNHTTVATGTNTLAGLVLDGGRVDFDTNVPADVISPACIDAGTGTINLVTGTVGVRIPAGATTPAAPQTPLLQQDDGALTKLAGSATTTGNIGGIKLLDLNTNALVTATQTAAISQSGAQVATGTYGYGLATGDAAGSNGLYVSYGLVAVDILANQTLLLASDTAAPAGAAEFHAVISGSGHLALAATSAITLNAANTYTGTTTITSGTVIAGANNALGSTSHLAITNTAALDLNGKTQTIGAYTGATGAGLLLNGGTLTVSATNGGSGRFDDRGARTGLGGGVLVLNGGTASGELTGAGRLELQSGTFTVTAANTGLAAGTTIAAGATADLKHTAALGSGSIAVDGALKLDLTAGGTFANALSGTGALIKTNTGTAVIAQANAGFAGNARVELGRLVLENLSALGAGATAAPVSVDAGATLEYRNANGAMRNAVSGSGTLAVTNSGSLAIAHDNTIANVALDNAVVYLSATNALGGSAARVDADAGSALWLAVDNARLGAMTLNGAKLGFTHSGSGVPPLFKTATLASLAGSNATLEFNVDFTATGLAAPGGAADHLTVTGTSAGTHTVAVNALGTVPGSGETAIPLITDARGAADYRLAGGKVDFGLTEFELASGAAASSTLPLAADTWYLFGTGLSEAADAIIDTASLLGKDWHYSLDALYLRMGDVRAELSGVEHPMGNVWVRSRGYRLNASNELSGRGFDQYAYGVTAGGDKAFRTESGVNLVGGFVDVGRITRDFDGNNEGATSNVSAGLYGTVLKDNGWYADLIFKADRYRHNFDAVSTSGRVISGDYSSNAYGVSLELGRRLERANGWWAEPSVQAAVAWLGGASYRTTPENTAINVKVDGSRAAQYRGLVRFGKQLRDSRWAPYGKLGAVRTDTDGGVIHAHDRTFASDFDGWRLEAGLGAAYRLNASSQLYLDYEYGRASAYERPWSLNLGYRRFW
ncbi:hypothetical protein AW736_02755 [Termitidicoccus mucosus]|uniref:Autotransporter domain-containing protein n=1 Tax=Termitidicoccus mucosus TaxID=1184151 RepID=A0A178IP82_9BACT|nr:hypothetical protein AW736_02755 [Opitutaceae bacterium TSB47]